MRLDVLLLKRGLVASREKAKDLIRLGYVMVNEKKVLKPSKDVPLDVEITIEKGFDYVSRGGYKLEYAVQYFQIDFRDKIVCDVGCSVGGFTDFALKRGARRIYAVDKGDNLHPMLRKNDKVVYFPNTDFLQFSLPETVDIFLIDVTFITLRDVIPKCLNFLSENGKIVALFKPPFEYKSPLESFPVKKMQEKEINFILQDFLSWLERFKFKQLSTFKCPIRGKLAKQIEYFIYIEK